MQTLSDYSEKLTSQLGQSQIKDNVSQLIEKIAAEQNCQLYSLSSDTNEYTRNLRMLNGELKTVVDVNKLNISLLANATPFFKDRKHITILHDVSPIRKPYSSKLESLGTVQSLEGKLIPGYETFNSVAVDTQSKTIRLLQCSTFSNGDEAYVSVAERYDYDNGQLKSPLRRAQIQALDEAGQSYNLKKIVLERTRQISQHIRSVNPDALIIDIYDRGFDDVALFEHTAELGQDFICRAKANRNSNEITVTEKGKEKKVKLVHQQFFKGEEIHLEKVRFKKRVYQNVKGVFEWNTLQINDQTYSIVRVSFYTRNGQRIFKVPMLLLTSLQVNSLQMAQLIFNMYLQRAKIEAVFKFCKETFGWEAPRLGDFEAIKNLLALVYFIAGYFYEIQDDIVANPTMIWLANLGNGKGKVTPHFLLKGLKKLMNYHTTKQFFKEQELNQKKIRLAINIFASNAP